MKISSNNNLKNLVNTARKEAEIILSAKKKFKNNWRKQMGLPDTPKLYPPAIE